MAMLQTYARNGVPAVVLRNTLLLGAAQALVGVGNQMVPALGSIMVVRLLGSAGLAGLGVAILAVGRLIVAYPLGRVMDAYGRRAGLVLGLLLGMAGAGVIALAMAIGSFATFVLGMFLFGLGVGATQQLRVAAADMYPPDRRAQGLGLVLTATMVGALGGPALVSLAEGVAGRLDADTVVTTWLLVPAVILPALAMVMRVHPDPRDIASQLELYYPGYRPETREASGGGMRGVLGSYACWTAFLCSGVAWGVMSMMMAMTSLVLEHHGHSLPAISLTVAIHVIGMFGLSLPLGRLADRLGRRPVLLLGLGITAGGAVMVPLTSHYMAITAGLFLVGLGWSAVTVAATALLADVTAPQQRAQAVGINDGIGAAAAVAMSFLGGPISEAWGHGALGVVSLAAAGLALLPLLALRSAGRRGTSPQPA